MVNDFEDVTVERWPLDRAFGFGKVPWSTEDVLLHEDVVGQRLTPGATVAVRVRATARGLRAIAARQVEE